jgi:hypothetical protein
MAGLEVSRTCSGLCFFAHPGQVDSVERDSPTYCVKNYFELDLK